MRQLSEKTWVFWGAAGAGETARNGYYLQRDGQRILVDPPGVADEDLPTFEHLGAAEQIVLTSSYRVDEARSVQQRLGGTIWLPRGCAVDAPDLRRFGGGDLLPGGLTVVTLPHPAIEGEVALLDPTGNALFIGATFAAVPAGKVSAGAGVPREAHRANLLAIGEPSFELLLPGYGFTLHRDGRGAVRRSVA